MDLFEVTDGYVHPSTHALLEEPFKSMWENDTSPDKRDCIKDFTYIEFICSPKRSNPYYEYPEEDRIKRVKKAVYGDEEYPVTSQVVLATLRYKEILSSTLSYELCNSALNAAHKVRAFLDDLDPKAATVGGALVLKPREILMALQQVPDTIEKLEKAKEKVNSDLAEASRTRNQREVGLFEN